MERNQLPAAPPFPVDAGVLFVAYCASAELGCFLALDWRLPARVLDLYAEFRCATNRITLPIGAGLLGALSYHGIPTITAEQKTEERAIAQSPWLTQPLCSPAGAGKTTSMRALVKAAHRRHRGTVLVLAPTGKLSMSRCVKARETRA